MSRSGKTNGNEANDMDDIGRLIRYAGARDTLPEERIDKARDRVAQHWERVVAEQRRERFAWRPVALAASVLLAVGAAFLLWRQVDLAPPVVIASVDRVVGEVRADGSPLSTGDAIRADVSIETGPGSRVALRLAGGQALRVDTDSRFVAHSANHLALDRGGIYIDTNPAANALPVTVATDYGVARDVGTQFQVRVGAGALVIGVREGAVEVMQQGMPSLAVPLGSYLELGPGGERKAGVLDPDDSAWDWVDEIAPEFDIDGATLHDYLAWYARENGFTLAWHDRLSEARARNIELSGSVSGMTLDEGLLLVQQIAPFDYRVEGHTLRVTVE